MNTLKKVLTVIVMLCCVGAAAADEFSLEGTGWDKAAASVGLDPILLYAVGLVESRTLKSREYTAPHPWTLNSPEGGEFFKTKTEAIARTSQLFARYKNIDIGLMQINWGWNGHKYVSSPSELLDPQTNLQVGASILAEAMKSTKDTVLGIGRYHNWRDERRARDYGRRVIRVYDALKELAEPEWYRLAKKENPFL